MLGTFIDFYGDFRVDARLVNVETSEIVKVESERMQRDHLYDIVKTVATKLMKDATLPPLSKPASDQRMKSPGADRGADVLLAGAVVPGPRRSGTVADMYQRGDRGLPRVR